MKKAFKLIFNGLIKMFWSICVVIVALVFFALALVLGVIFYPINFLIRWFDKRRKVHAFD